MSQFMNFRKIALSLAMFAVVAFASASGAKADTVTLNLTKGSTLPNGNYGTITLTLNAVGGIDVNVSLLNGAKVINGGQDCSICFNSSLSPDPTIGASGFSANYAPVALTPGSLHADGFGNYEYGVNYTGAGSGGGCTQCLSTVTFTITKAGGFSSVNDLIENSSGGGIASSWAVDIVINQGNMQTQATGFVGVGPAVPEPTSMLLLGTGLLGVAGLVRRRFRKEDK